MFQIFWHIFPAVKIDAQLITKLGKWTMNGVFIELYGTLIEHCCKVFIEHCMG